MAAFRRRALRATLTLAFALAAGVVADSRAASDLLPAAEIRPAAAGTAPRVVGQQTRQGQPVLLGSRIASGPGSGIRFSLLDGSVVIIGPNSVVSVDEFAQDRVVLTVERGAFYLDSANPGAVHVVLPTGTVAVRTATVAGRIGLNGTEVALLSVGRAEVTGFGGDSVRLDQIGQATRIIGLGSPSQPATLTPQRLQDFTGLPSQIVRRD